ncbi:MAG: TatD family hydrolase [Thermoleophilia bacterium]
MGPGRARRAGGGIRPAVPAGGGGGGVVDTHAHLDSCEGDPAEVVAEAAAAGVERIVAIGMGRASSERTLALADAHPGVYAAIGVHPHDADAFGPADEAWIRELAAHPKVVAIGECGLDHYRRHADPANQRRAFAAQIGLAREAGLPIVIHSREATQETLDMLAAEAEGQPVLLHCFSMPERVGEVAERGYLMSFAGQVTYRSAADLQAAARAVPDDLLLVETDSPYLAPVPRRGRPNAPANVAHTLRFIAGLRGIGEEELDDVTTRNAARLFGW